MNAEQRDTSGFLQPGGAPMHPEQIALIRSSFAILTTMGDDVTALFYGRLFDLDPTLKPMFKHDMAAQGRKFMTMLSVMVRGLEDMDRLLLDVQNLGRRHVAYGVQDVHYETMRQALLWALQHKLGDRWTPDVATAWNAAHTLLADTMIAAAREVPDDASDFDRDHHP